MANYTRNQLKERWEGAKCVNLHESYKAFPIESEYIPGLWEVMIFPRWIFSRFLDRKIFEPLDSGIMSRNVAYDPDSDHTQEWGWYRWRYYFDDKEGCYVLELDYDVEVEGKKALPLVKGILDIALLESSTSIIGKFKWRSPLLQKIPLIRRIGFIKAHRLLFYFEMTKIEELEMIESTTGYPARIMKEDENVIKFPKASESWGKVKLYAIFDPTKEGKCIAWLDTGEDETFSGEDDTCFQ